MHRLVEIHRAGRVDRDQRQVGPVKDGMRRVSGGHGRLGDGVGRKAGRYNPDALERPRSRSKPALLLRLRFWGQRRSRQCFRHIPRFAQ